MVIWLDYYEIKLIVYAQGTLRTLIRYEGPMV